MEMAAPVTDNTPSSDLLTACRNGDRDAMRELYVENQRRVFSVAMNYFGGRREIAEDITQRVFLKLLYELDFHGGSQFTTWLYRVTINACTDEARKMNRFVDLAGMFGIGEPRASGVQQLMAETGEVCDTVARAVSTLRPKLRVPIVLKYSEGLSYQEIADVIGCSTGTVASRLNRGHKALAAKLGHLRNEVL